MNKPSLTPAQQHKPGSQDPSKEIAPPPDPAANPEPVFTAGAWHCRRHMRVLVKLPSSGHSGITWYVCPDPGCPCRQNYTEPRIFGRGVQSKIPPQPEPAKPPTIRP